MINILTTAYPDIGSHFRAERFSVVGDYDMALKGPHHMITIAVPVPANSIIEQHKVMSTYSSEFDALKKKLPHGSECEDHVRTPRAEKHAAAAE